MVNETPLKRAERVLGGRSKLASICASSHKRGSHVSVSAVQQWHSTRVPARHVLTIEAATRKAGEEVTRYELCPEVFGKPERKRKPSERAVSA
jgi:DNA-binding transcriptional regulator YdaS (Cro superfamily)